VSRWSEVGDQTFVGRYEWLALTIGAVVGDDGVLLVDTRASHRQAGALIEDLKKLTDKPVRWVVNTHYHWDHCWGNAVFRDAELWGHENTRRQLLEHGEEARRDLLKLLSAAYHDEMVEVEIVPPAHTFSDRVSLEIGREVRLRYHGRGHTDSDISVAVSGVVFAGDLVEEAAPPAFGDAFPLDWPAALDQLLTYVDGLVVPGHGAPVERDFVQNQQADIAAAVELARSAHEKGTPIDSVDLRDYPFPADVSRSVVERAFAQLSGSI
jgi:glyoxylase-like metal-dependent hydrolase (beta-lactamase superfamily II)